MRGLPAQWLNVLAADASGKVPLGVVWGSVAGLLIGAGISIDMELFYSSGFIVTLFIIALCTFFGGLFGNVMESLLADSVVLMGHNAGGFQVIVPATAGHEEQLPQPVATIPPVLLTEKEKGEALAQRMQFAQKPSLAFYHADMHVFEAVLQAAHGADAQGRKKA